MRYLSILTSMIFIAGLFMVGQAFGAGQYGSSQSQQGSSAGMSGQSQSQQKMGDQQQQQAQQKPQQQQQKMAGSQLSQEQVKELQKSLNDRGFQSGPVDGIIGPKTKGALRNFQQFEGITASGEPDQQTLEALDIDAKQQEFIGVSPEFGQEQEQQQPEQQQQKEQQMDQMDQQQMDQQQEQQQPQMGQ